MATMNVLDAAGATVAVEKPLAPGRAAAAASRPVALSTEDKSALDAVATAANQSTNLTQTGTVTETAPATDTGSSGLNGRLQRVAQRLTSLIALLPTALGGAGGLKVEIVSGSSAGTEYTEDAAAVANPAGGMMMAVRRDTLTVAEVSADGDNVAVKATNKGQMHVYTEVGSLPSLPAGTNNIGDIDVLTLPAIPAGVNNIGHVGGTEYETVAASATAQAIGATGATGDYLAGVLIIPATTSPGAVSIKDGANAAITVFAGGASSVSNLVAFSVPWGAKSTAGAWQVTTGANVSAVAFGDFT